MCVASNLGSMLDTIHDVSLSVCDDLKTMNTHLKVRVCSSEEIINWQNDLDDFLIRSNSLLDETGDQETMNFNVKSIHDGQIRDTLFIKQTLDSCGRSLNLVIDIFQLLFELFKMMMPQNSYLNKNTNFI
jgi:hypothetical protein